MTNIQNKQSITCPECDTLLSLPKNILLGKIVECPACGTENEIIATNPIRLAPLEEEK